MHERSFFFNDTATTEIYTLTLHDALPIFDDLADLLLALVGVLTEREGDVVVEVHRTEQRAVLEQHAELLAHVEQDRKSTRLNSSHANISYAVFCLTKKKLHTLDLAAIRCP